MQLLCYLTWDIIFFSRAPTGWSGVSGQCARLPAVEVTPEDLEIAVQDTTAAQADATSKERARLQ